MRSEYGYCALTADCLHIGHINFMKKCKEHCDKLIVGLMTDRAVNDYKHQFPLMKYSERLELIQSLKMVYMVVPQSTFCFNITYLRMMLVHNMLIFDSEQHKRTGADILFSYTEGISSTKLKKHYLL